jgi:HK97 family phage portal protein
MKWPWARKNNVSNQTLDLNDDMLYDLIGGIPSMSSTGMVVNSVTAMKFSAVYGCVSLLSGCLASIPCLEKTNEKGFDETVEGSRLTKILSRESSPLMTAYTFWEAIGLDFWTAGNAYAIITRTGVGDAKSLIWVPASLVTPKFNEAKTRILYTISTSTKAATYDQDDILHFPCIGWDGLKGMSPIAAATEGIGLGLAGEKYNSHFFTNSITSDIAISYDKQISIEARKELEAYLSERYSNIENLRKPFIGSNGATVTKLGMSATDAQMIEARDYQVEDICRFYGIPPFMVGAMKKNTSFGSGLSEQTLGFVKFTFRRYVKKIEQEIDRKLIRHPKRFCKFNLDSLLRADIKTRNEAYKVALGGNQIPGYMTKNEVRRIEGLPPDKDPDSDKIYKPIDPTVDTTTEKATEETTETVTDEE